MLAEVETNSAFDYTSDCADFIANSQQKFGVGGVNGEFEAAIPLLCAVPTTAGTGSEGSQNAVISNADGVKVIRFIPKSQMSNNFCSVSTDSVMILRKHHTHTLNQGGVRPSLSRPATRCIGTATHHHKVRSTDSKHSHKRPIPPIGGLHGP